MVLRLGQPLFDDLADLRANTTLVANLLPERSDITLAEEDKEPLEGLTLFGSATSALRLWISRWASVLHLRGSTLLRLARHLDLLHGRPPF